MGVLVKVLGADVGREMYLVVLEVGTVGDYACKAAHGFDADDAFQSEVRLKL